MPDEESTLSFGEQETEYTHAEISELADMFHHPGWRIFEKIHKDQLLVSASVLDMPGLDVKDTGLMLKASGERGWINEVLSWPEATTEFLRQTEET